MASLVPQELTVELPVLGLRVGPNLPTEWTELDTALVGSLRVEGAATIHITPTVDAPRDPAAVWFNITIVDAQYRTPLSASVLERREIQRLNASLAEKIANPRPSGRPVRDEPQA